VLSTLVAITQENDRVKYAETVLTTTWQLSELITCRTGHWVV